MTTALERERLLDDADAILGRLPSGVEAEVRVQAGHEALTRFASSFIHQNLADAVRRVSIRLSLDGRVASAGTSQTDAAALDEMVRSTLEAARLRPVDSGWPGVAPPAEAPDVDHWDDATAGAEPAARASMVRSFVDAAAGLETAGYCSTDGLITAFANTAGQRLVGRASEAVIDGIARTATSDGVGRAASTALGDLDGGSVGGEAARRAREAAEPAELDPGQYEVVLEPGCVSNVVGFLAMYGFNGRAVEEERSFVRLGAPQFDAAIGLRDDVADPISVGIGFDAEGTPRRRVDLVRDGVTSAIVHDRRTARALGATSTGHAIPGGAEWGALPANLILSPGGRSREELIGSVERGLLVSDFWYTRILDPRTLVVTGLTRNGVWLIEDGKIGRPVSNLRFTQSYPEALAPGAVGGVGNDLTLVPGGMFGIGGYAVPSLHLRSWNFTGGARG